MINDAHEESGAAASILCGLEIRENQHQNKDPFDLPNTPVYRSEIQYSDSKPPCHFSHFPLTSFCVPVHIDCKSAGSRDCILAKILSVTSSFIFYFRSCSALLLAVCSFFFFLLLLFLAQVYIVKHPADEADCSKSKSEYTAELAGLRSEIKTVCL